MTLRHFRMHSYRRHMSMFTVPQMLIFGTTNSAHRASNYGSRIRETASGNFMMPGDSATAVHEFITAADVRRARRIQENPIRRDIIFFNSSYLSMLAVALLISPVETCCTNFGLTHSRQCVHCLFLLLNVTGIA